MIKNFAKGFRLTLGFLGEILNPLRVKEENEKLNELTQGIIRDPFGQAARRYKESQDVEG